MPTDTIKILPHKNLTNQISTTIEDSKYFEDAEKKTESNKEVNRKRLSSTALDHLRCKFPV